MCNQKMEGEDSDQNQDPVKLEEDPCACLTREPFLEKGHWVQVFGVSQISGPGMTKFLACVKCGACLSYSFTGSTMDLKTADGLRTYDSDKTLHQASDIVKQVFDLECCSTKATKGDLKYLKQLSRAFNLHTSRSALQASKNVGQAGKRSLIRSGVIYAYPLSAVEEAYKGHVEMKEEQGVDRNTARRQFSASSDKTENLMKKVVGRALLHVHSPKDLNFTLNLSNEGSHASSTFSKNIVGVSTEMRSDKLLSKDVMDTQLTLTSEDCRQDQVVVSNGNFTVLQKGSLDEGLNNSRDEVFIYKKHCVKTFFMNKFGSQGDFLACLNCGACLAHTLYDLRDPGKKPITEGVTVRETAEHLYGKDVITEFFDIECGGPSVQDTQELQPLSNDDYVQNYSYSEFLQMQHQKGVKGTEMPFLSCLRIINLHTKAPVLRASKNVGQAARRSYSRHGAILCYRLSEMRESYRTHIKKLVKGNLPKRETGGGKRTHSELQETPAPVPSRQRQEVDTKRTKRSEFHSSGKMSSRLGSGLSLMIQEAVSPIAGIAGTC